MTGTWFGFFVLSLLNSAIADNELGIIGGHEIDIKEAPYQIGLFFMYSGARYFQCGGSIITKQMVISAAHCVYGHLKIDWVVLVGSAKFDSGNPYSVKKAVHHPDFSRETADYDVSLLLLEKDLELNEKIALIPLASKGSEIPTNEKTFISGWGAVDQNHHTPKMLQGVEIPAVAKEVCEKSLNATFTPRQLCVYAKGKSPCYGDSGGPLVYNGTLYGLTSFGNIDCSGPAGFTKVSALRDWIDKTIKDLTAGI